MRTARPDDMQAANVTATEIDQRTKTAKPAPIHPIINELIKRELELVKRHTDPFMA